MLGLLLVQACFSSETRPPGAPDAVTQSPMAAVPVMAATDDCAGEPAVRWDNWGSGFFRTWCQSCHSIHTTGRSGAPEGIDFDSEEAVKRWSDTIRRTVLDEGSMPLGSGLNDDERRLLDVLLRCGLSEHPSTDSEDLEISPPSPALDAAGFEAAVESALIHGFADPMTAREAWRASLSARQPPCPSGNQWSWGSSFDGCTTSSGWTFAGIAEYTGDIETLPDDGAFELLADCSVVDPTGAELRSGGQATLTRSGSRFEGSASGRLAGTWSLDGGGGWLEDGFSGVLELEASWDDDDWSLSLDGSQQTSAGILAVEGLRADRLDCPAGTATMVSLRDSAGYWYRLDLADGCGCGELTYGGSTDLGEACLDLQLAAEGLVDAVRPQW